ncbi:MAG: prephenate dehydrogenase/arogenate dehydrogenase family protein [Acidobacteriota bacterium]
MSALAVGRLLIVGTGLIGTSIARALRRRADAPYIVGMDLPAALDRHGREAFDDLRPATAAVPDYDLAVLACPVDRMPEWLRRFAADRPSTPVTDVGGVKRAPAAAAAAAGVRAFVGGHPMAGAARPGPALASASLFDGRPWFVVPGAGPAEATALVAALASACGATPLTTTAEAHDALVAAMSHLPQLASSLLMQTVSDRCDDAGIACAGAGLRDATRLASSSAEVWQPLVAANADHLAPLLIDLADRLRAAAAELGDGPAVAELFAAANRARRRLEPPL